MRSVQVKWQVRPRERAVARKYVIGGYVVLFRLAGAGPIFWVGLINGGPSWVVKPGWLIGTSGQEKWALAGPTYGPRYPNV